MSETPSLCPLCGKDAKYLAADQKLSDTYNVRCDRCGEYKITWEALKVVKPEHKFRLSAFCRRAGKPISPPMIRSDNIDKLLETVPVFGPLEKLDNLLLLLGDRTSKLGGNALLNEELDAALLICHEDEIAFLKETLWTDGFIQNKNASTQVTMKGWERIQQIQKSGKDSKRAFVAMWFDPLMDEVYDKAIAPAISRAGYLPLRIDRHPHVNRIDDEIIGQIKRCRFMVADFTGQRHSVYFEAGMMHGLARNVIWMCKKDELNDVRFDVRQFAFIAYASVSEAEKLLYDKILAIEGEGLGETLA